MPIVSIIIPAYNVEGYVSKGIESACRQTIEDIEIILVDDGSTDGTREVILDYARKDNRIKAFFQANAGVSSARNRALDMACGTYVVFLDSDDWLEENAIEGMLKHTDMTGRELVCCEYNYVELEKGNTVITQMGKDAENAEYSRDEALQCVGRRSNLRLQSSCYKLFSLAVINEQKLRFDTDIHQGEDGLFTFKYLLGVEKIRYLNAPLWNILNRPGSACNGGYNKKWNTAIDAVDQMLQYEDQIGDSVKRNLLAFKAERAMWILNGCLRSNEPADRTTVRYMQMILRKNGKYLIKRKKSFKTLIECVLLISLPVWILKPLQKIIVRNK